jgi:hypothetical protein
MATTLLAVGSSPAASADFTIAAGGSAMLLLFGSASGPVSSEASVRLESKVGSVYTPVYQFAPGETARIVQGDALAATTWRVYRNPAGSSQASFGVQLV